MALRMSSPVAARPMPSGARGKYRGELGRDALLPPIDEKVIRKRYLDR